ncbi:glycosyltransferase family 2 protein [Stieleria varia]|uniref:Hyaluronan synthase n=1 Tax=Stieleria varia TaxID=2528005 RepID=A0A5C6AQL8_9BACT|nr:glycosyltransferase family A protein [Stieleria varia]TWU01272.1 Hyaluronan synthase [Stieleria varia]
MTTLEYCVVIPAYNRESQIGRTLEAILKQRIPPVEICVVDDGSIDGTADVAASFGPSVRVVSVSNGGPASARRIGIAETSAEWVLPCDSDDVWHAHFIDDLIGLHQEFPNAGLLFVNFRILGPNNEVLLADKLATAPEEWLKYTENNSQHFDLGKEAYVPLLRFSPIFQSCVAFRRSLYDEIGGIDPVVARMPAEDAHLTKRLVAHTQTVGSRRVGVDIHREGDNFSSDFPRIAYGSWWILRDLCQRQLVPSRFIEATRQEIERRAPGVGHLLFAIRDYDSMNDVLKSVPLFQRDWKLQLKAAIAKAALLFGNGK